MNDTYVSTTSYASDSTDYVSSEVADTPFPSLSKSQKIKLNELIHGGKNPTPKVSTFTQSIDEMSDMNFNEEDRKDVEEHEVELKIKNSCCCLC